MSTLIRLNLRSFTVLLAFCLASLCAGLAVLFVHKHLHQSAADEAGHMATASARVAAELIDSDLHDRSGTFVGLGRIIEDQRLWANPEALRRVLDHVQGTIPGTGWIGLTDNEGRIVVGSGGLAVGADVSKRNWFLGGQAGLHHGDLHEAMLLQKAMPPLPNGELWRFIDIAMPIHDERGRKVGVMGVHLSWPWLRDKLLTAEGTLPFGGQFWVVGADNRPRLGGEGVKDESLKLRAIERARQGQRGWTVEAWPDGHTYVTAYAPQAGRGDFKGFGWVTLVRTRADSHPPTLEAQYHNTVFAAIALVLITTLAAWGASTLWLTPLRAFVERIRHLRAGQLPPALPRWAPQEFQTLNYAIQHLLAQVEAKEERLRDALQDVQHSFRSVGSSIPGVLATFHINQQGKVAFDFVSETCERYFGVTGEQLAGEPRAWTRHADARDVDAIAMAMRQLVEHGESIIIRPLRVTGGDGISRTLQVTLVQRDEGRGRVFDTICLDVTELESARREAERASRAKSDFLATMSHELRTPLNAILGFAQVLEGSLVDTEQRTQARYVRETGETLTRILNDVLDIAKIEAGKFDLDPQPFAISQVLDSCASIFRVVGANKGVGFEVSAPDTLPQLVGDPVRLRQILHNLLSNAFKFTASGSVRLIVEDAGRRVDDADRERAHLTLRVEDTGVGMTPEQVGRLFQRFEQADRSTATLYGGTGLGLAIVKVLVDKMGGRIEVDSRHGAGTAITLHLDFDPAGRPGDLPAAPLGAERPLRVLVVDDFHINRHVLRALLQKRGHAVIEAEDGVQALDCVGRQRPDLVLMDVDMPHMDGLEATRRIRAMDGPAQAVPVYALTGKAFAEDIQRASDAGMNGHLSKPVQLDELVRVLQTVALAAAADATGARA